MTNIPNDNHVVRHCRARNVYGNDVSGGEFELRLNRPNPEDYLSVNWLEKSGKELLEEQLLVVRKQIPLTPKSKDRLARLNVGSAKSRVFDNVDNLEISFRLIGGRQCSTYSGIFDIPMIERISKAVGIQLAIVASGNLHPAVEPTDV